MAAINTVSWGDSPSKWRVSRRVRCLPATGALFLRSWNSLSHQRSGGVHCDWLRQVNISLVVSSPTCFWQCERNRTGEGSQEKKRLSTSVKNKNISKLARETGSTRAGTLWREIIELWWKEETCRRSDFGFPAARKTESELEELRTVEELGIAPPKAGVCANAGSISLLGHCWIFVGQWQNQWLPISDYLSLGYKSSLVQKKKSDETILPKTDPEDHWFEVALTTDKNINKSLVDVFEFNNINRNRKLFVALTAFSVVIEKNL